MRRRNGIGLALLAAQQGRTAYPDGHRDIDALPSGGEEDIMTIQPSANAMFAFTNGTGRQEPRDQRASNVTAPRIVAQRLKPARKGNPEGWVAHYEGFDDTAMWGMGRTEAAAIAQLKEIWPLQAAPAAPQILTNSPRLWVSIILRRLAFGVALAACAGIPLFIVFGDALR